MKAELQLVFGPEVELDKLHIVPTFQVCKGAGRAGLGADSIMQCSREDLVGIGPAVEAEKDRLLQRVCCQSLSLLLLLF